MMPERLFVCTPSKLARTTTARAATGTPTSTGPRRRRGPPWAHNSLGASVHTALRNWWDLPAERRRARRCRAAAGDLGPRGLPRRGAGAGGLRAGAGLAGGVRRGLDPDLEPLGVERTVAAKTPVLALCGRADRIDARGGELVIVDYKTGRTGLDADDARGSRALALYAFAAERMFRRRCRTGRAAPPADRHGRRARAHRRVDRPARGAGRGHRARHRRGREGAGRRHAARRGVPDPAEQPVQLVRLPPGLPGGRGGAGEGDLGGGGGDVQPAVPPAEDASPAVS